MMWTRWSPALRTVGMVGALVLGATACSGSSDDAVDTFASIDAPAVDSGAATAGEGPLAVAAASSEAELARRRAEAGDTLKSFTVTISEPVALAGKITPDTTGALCSGPGTVVDGESFEVSFTVAKDSNVTGLSIKTLGSYEGPGSYSAEITSTGETPMAGTGTVFVYDDEMSGEFALTTPAQLTGTWECRFKS